MPLYEYQCRRCGERIEKIQRFSDAPLTTCEKCSGELERLISSSAFQFKGTGWYVTDYANKKEAAPDNGKEKKSETKESGGSQPAAESSSKGETKSESKNQKAETKTTSSASSGSTSSGSKSAGEQETGRRRR